MDDDSQHNVRSGETHKSVAKPSPHHAGIFDCRYAHQHHSIAQSLALTRSHANTSGFVSGKGDYDPHLQSHFVLDRASRSSLAMRCHTIHKPVYLS